MKLSEILEEKKKNKEGKLTHPPTEKVNSNGKFFSSRRELSNPRRELLNPRRELSNSRRGLKNYRRGFKHFPASIKVLIGGMATITGLLSELGNVPTEKNRSTNLFRLYHGSMRSFKTCRTREINSQPSCAHL